MSSTDAQPTDASASLSELNKTIVAGEYGKGYQGWADYINVRPPYPQEMFDEVFAYHDQGTRDRNLCVDFGTGNGTIVQRLLDAGFAKVEASDINEPQIAQAKEAFSGNHNVHFHVKDASEKHEWIQDGSASMATCFEAVHWFRDKTPSWFKEVARILQPGGTCAFCFYPGDVTIISHKEAGDAFKSFTISAGMYREPLKEDVFFQFATGMLHLPGPSSSDFTGTKRIAWYKFPSGYSHIADDVLNGAGPEWDDWRRELKNIDQRPIMLRKRMNMEMLMIYFDSIHGVGSAMRKSDVWQKISQQIVDATGDDFEVGWPLMLCMLRRK